MAPQGHVPDWWEVSRETLPEGGAEVRLAFRELPTHNVWFANADPDPAELDRMARLILKAPPHGGSGEKHRPHAMRDLFELRGGGETEG